MKRLIKVVEGIGQGCANALVISGIGAIGSVLIMLAPPVLPQLMVEVSGRVLVMSLTVVLFSTAGCCASVIALSQLTKREVEEPRETGQLRDKYWESLVSELWHPSSKFCLASCRGCKHLVGEVGLEKYFICAYHPYGWEGNDCPNWEKLANGKGASRKGE